MRKEQKRSIAKELRVSFSRVEQIYRKVNRHFNLCITKSDHGYLPSITFHGQDLIGPAITCDDAIEAIDSVNKMRSKYLLPMAFAKKYKIPRKSILLLNPLTEKMMTEN